MISFYSAAAAIVWLSVALCLIALLRKRTGFMLRYSAEVLLFAALLSLVRLLMPLDFKQAYVVRSFRIVPAVMDFLARPLFGRLTAGRLMLLVWAAGGALVLLGAVLQLIVHARKRRQYRSVRSAPAERAAERAGLKPGTVVVSPDVPVPMTAGLLRPKIYLPTLNLSSADLDWILRHEQQHLKSHDVWLKLLYMVLQSALWWNPIVWLFARELDSILELRCDQLLLAGQDKVTREAYVRTLLNVTQQLVNRRRHYPASVATFARGAPTPFLARRAELVLYAPPRHRSASIAAALVCVAIFIGSYFVLIQPAGFPEPEEELGNQVVITAENSYLVHTEDDQYELWFNGVYLSTFEKSDLHSYPLCDLEIREQDKGE